MAGLQALTPLHPQEFFGRPWSGTGEWTPRPWLRWLPGPRGFRFESTTTWISDEVWLLHDTIVWENGVVERRDGTARLLDRDRVRLTYADMLGGTELQLHADGFSFSPYRMLITNPLLPIPLVVHARDSCHWHRDTQRLDDTIEMRLLAVPLGCLTMSLRPGDT
jgi:hypothetical protein